MVGGTLSIFTAIFGLFSAYNRFNNLGIAYGIASFLVSLVLIFGASYSGKYGRDVDVDQLCSADSKYFSKISEINLLFNDLVMN